MVCGPFIRGGRDSPCYQGMLLLNGLICPQTEWIDTGTPIEPGTIQYLMSTLGFLGDFELPGPEGGLRAIGLRGEGGFLKIRGWHQ